MKKILVYVNSMQNSGGVERVIANLFNCLADKYKIVILVKDEEKSFYVLDDRIKIETLKCEIKLNMNNKLQRIISVFRNIIVSKHKLRGYLKKNHFDYIYVATPTNAYEVYKANKNILNRLVVSEHASYFAPNKIYQKMKEIVYPKAYIISVPTTMDTEIYKKLGYNAIYIPHMTTFEQTIKNKMDKKVALNVGRLTSDKQQEMLIDMWHKAKQQGKMKDWQLIILGNGEEKKKLEDKISSLQEQTIRMLPSTQEIEEIYRQASMFVFTSKMEGFGMVLLEAMAYGIPCISFDCPSGSRDIISNGINGFLIECFEQDEYIRKMSYLAENQEVLESFSQASWEKVSKWNNLDIEKQWYNVFK